MSTSLSLCLNVKVPPKLGGNQSSTILGTFKNLKSYTQAHQTCNLELKFVGGW